PEPLRPLNRLARNLRWSWHPETRELFESVDPEGWRESGGDPVRLLGAVPLSRLADLAEDRSFLRRLTAAADDLHDYLTGPRWYQGRVAAEDRAGLPTPVESAPAVSPGASVPSDASVPAVSPGASVPSDASVPTASPG
ncbi:DUF3417 domain-containing protein, partial [Streptomyces albiflaviniger]|nr:DUF3417 domain-containing protein [Streptomyces albiflaviniger]